MSDGNSDRTWKFEFGDNAKAVVLAIIGVIIMILQIYQSAQLAANASHVREIKSTQEVNTKNIETIKKDVRAQGVRVGVVPPSEKD